MRQMRRFGAASHLNKNSDFDSNYDSSLVYDSSSPVAHRKSPMCTSTPTKVRYVARCESCTGAEVRNFRNFSFENEKGEEMVKKNEIMVQTIAPLMHRNM